MLRFALKLSAGLLAAFLTFNIGVFGVLVNSLRDFSFSWISEAPEDARQVELCALVNDASQFDGVLVRVKARVKVLNFGRTRLFNETCSATVNTESASRGDTVRYAMMGETESRGEAMVTGRIFAGYDAQDGPVWSGFYVTDIEHSPRRNAYPARAPAR